MSSACAFPGFSMLILISPAKTLDFDSPPPVALVTEPQWIDRSKQIMGRLRKFSPRKLGALMQISPALAELNVTRYRNWQGAEDAGGKQAVFAFDGDVYEGLRAARLNRAEIRFAQDHLRILSGLYGILRPLDRIEPYRLEMGTRLRIAQAENLYRFWSPTVTAALNREVDALRGRRGGGVIVNLASDEYFKVVDTKALAHPVVTPVFEECKAGRYQVVSFFAKRARGLMTRYAIAGGHTDPAALLQFSEEGYQFARAASSETVWRFRRNRENGA